MKRRILFAGALFLAVAAIVLFSQEGRGHQAALSQVRQSPEGAVLTGVWYWQINMDMVFTGAVLPSLLAFHKDGTSACSDSVAFGGTPTNIYRYTPFYGVWERLGPHTFSATFMSLRFDTTKSNVLVGIVRSRATFKFAEDFDHVAGTMHMDFLACPSNPYGFLMCPNPLLAAEGDWQPWLPGMPSDYSFTGARVSNVPY